MIRSWLAHRYKQQGNRARAAGQINEALACYQKALRILPTYAEAANNLGLVLNELGKEAESFAWYRRAIAWQPGLRAARWNLANALLAEGNFAQGWAAYEARLTPAYTQDEAALARLLAPFGNIPRWQGEPLSGRRILLWSEQGLGDNLLMMRYLSQFARRFGVRPDFWCEAPLLRLAQTLPEIGKVITTLHDPDYDYHCSLLSLPWHFQTRLDNIPSANAPYLALPDAARMPWRARCNMLPGRKIGLVWGGHTVRDLLLSQLAPLLALPNISWISLQHGEPARQLLQADLSTRSHTVSAGPGARTQAGLASGAADNAWGIHDWMDECHDLFDTAALMSELDIVLSIDTSLANLAGALGRPLILLCRMESNWRWRCGEKESPWYSQTRIIRQRRYGEWGDAIARAAAALAAQS